MKIILINRTQGTPIKVPIVLETPEEFQLPLSAGVSTSILLFTEEIEAHSNMPTYQKTQNSTAA